MKTVLSTWDRNSILYVDNSSHVAWFKYSFEQNFCGWCVLNSLRSKICERRCFLGNRFRCLFGGVFCYPAMLLINFPQRVQVFLLLLRFGVSLIEWTYMTREGSKRDLRLCRIAEVVPQRTCWYWWRVVDCTIFLRVRLNGLKEEFEVKDSLILDCPMESRISGSKTA